jgi:hypothetical protein
MRWHVVALYLASFTPHEVLHPPSHGVKGVSCSHEGILMSVVLAMLVVYHEFLAGHVDVHAYVEEIATMLVSMELLHDHPATDYVVAESFELVYTFVDICFQRW